MRIRYEETMDDDAMNEQDEMMMYENDENVPITSSSSSSTFTALENENSSVPIDEIDAQLDAARRLIQYNAQLRQENDALRAQLTRLARDNNRRRRQF
jgi:hypothetical protein